MKGAALALTLVTLVACTNPPLASASPASIVSPSPGRTAPPAPMQLTCGSRIPAAANLTLVTLPDRTGISIRDISDLSSPISRCLIHGTGATHPRFKDAGHVSYIVRNAAGRGALYVADLLTRRTSLVRSWTDAAFMDWVYAWSPDAKTLTYLSSDSTGVAWHLLSAAGDLTLSRFGPMPGRGVDPESDDGMTGFSADGQYVALENTFTGADSASALFQVVRLSDHKLVYSRRDGTMATWSGSGAHLYFRTIAGLESWDPKAGAQNVVPGLAWIHPWASADGLRIAYTASDGTGNHQVGYLRLTDQSPVGIVWMFKHPGTKAVFLNSTLVWYAEEASCAQAQCGLGGPPQTGRTFLVDLVVQSERPSVDTAVFDSWPRAGAA
ncbi:MAG: hypothetical protein ABI959_12660 [Candidatus Dormiibacterota bacterium]